jgi:tRNA dimethylallyltransferase
VIRALEVYRLTGRPISEHWSQNPPLKKGGRGDFLKLGLDLPKPDLDRRIESRVEDMIEQGLLAEVRGLLSTWGPSAPGLKLIGYKEIADYLTEKTTLEEAVALVIRHTRQYAKRQRTWFRKDQEIQWFRETESLFNLLTK